MSAREAISRNADLASLAQRVQRDMVEVIDGRADNGATNRGANDNATNGSGVKLGGACASPLVVAPSMFRATKVGLVLVPVAGSSSHEVPVKEVRRWRWREADEVVKMVD